MNLFISCGMQVLILVSPGVKPMNDFDYAQIPTAMDRCVVHFPQSPCLKKFTKVGEREYEARCGKEKN